MKLPTKRLKSVKEIATLAYMLQAIGRLERLTLVEALLEGEEESGSFELFGTVFRFPDINKAYYGYPLYVTKRVISVEEGMENVSKIEPSMIGIVITVERFEPLKFVREKMMPFLLPHGVVDDLSGDTSNAIDMARQIHRELVNISNRIVDGVDNVLVKENRNDNYFMENLYALSMQLKFDFEQIKNFVCENTLEALKNPTLALIYRFESLKEYNKFSWNFLIKVSKIHLDLVLSDEFDDVLMFLKDEFDVLGDDALELVERFGPRIQRSDFRDAVIWLRKNFGMTNGRIEFILGPGGVRLEEQDFRNGLKRLKEDFGVDITSNKLLTYDKLI